MSSPSSRSVIDLMPIIRHGEAIAAVCVDTDAAIDALNVQLNRLDLKVVTLRWTAPGSSVERLIDEAVDGIARLSLALWPDWNCFGVGDEAAAAETHADKRIMPQWRELAARYCESGEPPVPHGYPAATQVGQLSLTLAPDRLAILMAVDRVKDSQALISVRSVAEWLAANAAAAVIVLLPREVGLYDGLRTFPLVDLFGPLSDPEPVPGSARVCDRNESPIVGFYPVIGAPHPLSAGEKRLAERLLSDPELGRLFAFNRRIRGRHGNEYIVDLFWPEGGLVVEVDSFQLHGNRFAFARDRHRDYELMAANYRVLRITNDEAETDTESAVEKIRLLVKMIQESRSSK